MTVSPEKRAELRAMIAKATPGPWAYRPGKHDDWGFVRGAEVDSSIGRIRPPVAIAREGYPFSTGEQDHQHRLAGTDPYFHNAALIVAAVNALPGLLDEVERLRELVSDLERNTVELYRGIAPAGNYGANRVSSHRNESTFADADPIVIRARAAIAPIEGGKDRG